MDLIKPPRKKDEKPGVYVIRHMVTGLRYIGSSKNPLNRVYAHVWFLKKGSHTNILFQTEWTKCDDFYLTVYNTNTIAEARELERAMLADKSNHNVLLNIVGVHDTNKIIERRIKVKPMLLERIEKQKRKILADGKEYESVRFCERVLGASQRTIVRRIESNKIEFANWKYV